MKILESIFHNQFCRKKFYSPLRKFWANLFRVISRDYVIISSSN